MAQVGDVITVSLPADHELHGRAFAVLTVADDGTPDRLMPLPAYLPAWCWAQHPDLVAQEMAKRSD